MCAVLHAWHGADVYLAADPTTLLAARTGGKPKPSVCVFYSEELHFKGVPTGIPLC